MGAEAALESLQLPIVVVAEHCLVLGDMQIPKPWSWFLGQTVDPETVPLNQPLVQWLRLQTQRGRRIFLCGKVSVAQLNVLAMRIAPAVSVLDAPTPGQARLLALRAVLGAGLFVFVGQARVDAPMWQEAAGRISVNDPVSGVRGGARLFDTALNRPVDMLRGMRPAHWVKNALVFLPLLASHRWGEEGLWWASVQVFMAFSLSSSAMYWINDLLDLADDRADAHRRGRPLAAGKVSIHAGLVLAGVSMASGMGLAAHAEVLGVVVLYLASALGYSVWGKTVAWLDVGWLVGLHLMRIVAGGQATGIQVSIWLFAFSAFLLGSLACCKRCAEFTGVAHGLKTTPRRRSYGQQSQRRRLTASGIVCGVAAIAVVPIYIWEAQMASHYASPILLGCAAALLFFWLGRLWLNALRARIPGDPVLFALQDPLSLVSLVGVLCLFLGAVGL